MYLYTYYIYYYRYKRYIDFRKKRKRLYWKRSQYDKTVSKKLYHFCAFKESLQHIYVTVYIDNKTLLELKLTVRVSKAAVVEIFFCLNYQRNWNIHQYWLPCLHAILICIADFVLIQKNTGQRKPVFWHKKWMVPRGSALEWIKLLQRNDFFQ